MDPRNENQQPAPSELSKMVEAVPRKLEIARAHGRFWADIMDILTQTAFEPPAGGEPTGPQKLRAKIGEQPPELKPLYRVSFYELSKALRQRQHDLESLQEIRNEPNLKKLLLDILFEKRYADATQPLEIAQRNILLRLHDELYEDIPALLDKLDLITFAPGIFGLMVEDELFAKLTANPYDPFSGTAGESVPMTVEDHQIAFLLLPTSPYFDTVRHELHHLLWNVLGSLEPLPKKAPLSDSQDTFALQRIRQKQEFAKQTLNEPATPSEIQQGLKNFKDELVAYILSMRSYGLLEPEDISNMTYILDMPDTAQNEINDLAKQVFVSVRTMLAEMEEQQGSDQDVHLLLIDPIMRAQGFIEIRKNCEEIFDAYLKSKYI